MPKSRERRTARTNDHLFGHAPRRDARCRSCGESAEPYSARSCWRCCHDGTLALALARTHGGRMTAYELRVLVGMCDWSAADCEAMLDALAARGLGRWADLSHPLGHTGRTLVLTREAREGVARAR